MLGNDDPVASVCGEVVPRGHEFYDYAAKYLDADGADLADPRGDRRPMSPSGIQRMAVTAFRAVECWGMARVDFFLDAGRRACGSTRSTRSPGSRRSRCIPKLWEASGLAYPELIERLLELAVERHAAERVKARARAS